MSVLYKLTKIKKPTIIIAVALLLTLGLIVFFVAAHDGSWKTVYTGGYSPAGEYCDFGYNKTQSECCQDDDYSCEMCDLYGLDCEHTDPQFDNVAKYENRVSSGDYDCSDFESWEDAQKVFIRDGGPSKDPYILDANRDHIACESLRNQ